MRTALEVGVADEKPGKPGHSLRWCSCSPTRPLKLACGARRGEVAPRRVFVVYIQTRPSANHGAASGS